MPVPAEPARCPDGGQAPDEAAFRLVGPDEIFILNTNGTRVLADKLHRAEDRLVVGPCAREYPTVGIFLRALTGTLTVDPVALIALPGWPRHDALSHALTVDPGAGIDHASRPGVGALPGPLAENVVTFIDIASIVA